MKIPEITLKEIYDFHPKYSIIGQKDIITFFRFCDTEIETY